MKYEELISLTIELISSFNPNIMSQDSHCQQFIIQHSKTLYDTEKTFIQQIFSGQQRYYALLQVFTKALFDQTTASNRNDNLLFQIFAYITLFRFNEIPFNEYKSIIQSQDPQKMHVLFTFLFDKKVMNNLIKPQWIEIYDPQYIEEIFQDLEDNFTLFKPILTYLNQKATRNNQIQNDIIKNIESISNEGEQVEKEYHQKNNTSKPFELTKAQYKELPQPLVFPRTIKPNPVPQSVYNTSVQKIQEEKIQRRQDKQNEILQSYEKSIKKPFELKTAKRPNKFDKVKQEIESQQQAQLQFNKKLSIQMPDFEKSNFGQVKFNVAQVLREQVKFDLEKEKDDKKIKQLEENLRDSTEFENWKQKQKAMMKIEKIEHQQQMKIEMELARELAVKAQQDQFQENKCLADDMKGQEKIRQQERELNKVKDIESKKKIIDSVIDSRENMGNEKIKMIQKNKQIHDEELKQKDKLMERKKLEDEMLLKKRQDLIKQIRELEKQPHRRETGYDPTETAGIGLFDEMSMVELREKLEELKITMKMQEEQKRSTIIEEKTCFANKIKEISNVVLQEREKHKQKKNEERLQKLQEKLEDEMLKKEAREKSLLAVNDQIIGKKDRQRKQEQKIADDDKETKLRQQYMSANKEMVEFKQWEGQEMGYLREMKYRQNDKLMTQYKSDSINFKDRKVFSQAAASIVEQKIEFSHKYDDNIESCNKANLVLFKEMRNFTQGNHEGQRNWDIKHQGNMTHMNEYRAKINEMSIAKSKQYASMSKFKY